MARLSWSGSISIFILSGAAAWLATTGTLPALRARAAAERKNVVLQARRAELQDEIHQLKAEADALRSDFQYNRRLERLMFRGAPERGD
jgi:cell division protein FtsB